MQIRIVKYPEASYCVMEQNGETAGFYTCVMLHRDRTSDADSLRRSAAEARAKAARELKRAERMERAADQLTKG